MPKIRRILSKEEEEKKTRRNQFLIGGAMIFVMVASVLGYSLSRENTGSSEKITYNGVEFTKQSGFWNAAIGSYQFSFKYNPQEVNKVNSMLNPLKNYAGKPLYIYSDNIDATTEIYRNLFYQNRIAARVQEACIEGKECENDVPLKTCEDNFVIIEENNQTGVRQEQNCVFISGNMTSLTQLSDSFLFKIIGVQ